MTSTSRACNLRNRQFAKRLAMVLAFALAIAGGIAWRGTGMAGVSSPDSAVNWRGPGNDGLPPGDDLAVNWRGTGSDQVPPADDLAVNWRGLGDDTPPPAEDLAVNWRGKDRGGEIITPPTS